jgi:NAD(P)H-hydrate epimerase
MEENIEALVNLFKEAGQAHHQAFIETNGADTEWPLWYAGYLQEKIAPLLGHDLTKSELVYQLVHLDKLQRAEAPDEAWPLFYARYLAEHYAGGE